MDELAGFAMGGDEVVPATGDVSGGKAEYGVGEGVALVVVVKEPGVGAALRDGGLYLIQFQNSRLR